MDEGKRKETMTETQTTRDVITPILYRTYGKGKMVDSLADHLAAEIDAWAPDPRLRGTNLDRETMIMRVCWDWMTGGSTAESVAREIDRAVFELNHD